MDKHKSLVKILDNLFKPINNKDYGLYWNVSKNKTKPLANAEALLKYIKKESKEGTFINRYANLTEDLVLENSIYLDFDLKNKDYLKAEQGLTENVLRTLSETEIAIPETDNYHEKNPEVHKKQIKQKYEKDYSIENDFTKGFNNFIDSLTEAESGTLKKLVSEAEKEELKGKTEQEIQKYYIDKFERNYLIAPFKEATTVAKYFNSIGVKTILNWSGSKGLHLRIPITRLDFEGSELEEHSEAVKLFLKKLAELIETKILKKSYNGSSLDYAVFCKGMQRLPTSKHNKTKLYANFIEPTFKYVEAIDYLEAKVPEYIPEEVDLEANTETLVESDIYKATIEQAVEDTKIQTYSSEIGNIAYNFSSTTHEELKKMILEIYPESLNFFPYKVIHLLKRSGFSKGEVEDIFHDVEPDPKEYNKNIKGNIRYTFENPNAKICGLKNLIEWIKENYPNHEKDHVIKYFSKNFKYYEVPVETLLEDTLLINEKEHNLTVVSNSKKKYFLLKNLDYVEGNTIEIDKEKAVVYFKQDDKPIAKLQIQPTAEGLVPSSVKKLNDFKKRIHKKTGVEEAVIVEAIEELNLYIDYYEELQKEEKQLQELEERIVKEVELETTSDTITFHGSEETYIQKDTGIYEVKTDRNNNEYHNPVANMVIKNVEIILDSLGILEPVYNVTYYNRTFKKEVTVKYLKQKRLTEEFIEAKVFYNATKENINYILNSFIIEGSETGRIETKTEAYLEGYFIVNDKVVSNTKLDKLKKPTPEEVAEAIQLLNEIMSTRSAEGKANDSTVYRFMLWNPFSYCFKQLGYGESIYSLILAGKSQGNKTGATKTGRLFYLHTEEETAGSTVSVVGSKLEENSYCSVFDECEHLFSLKEALTVMKRAVYEKTARATKDRNDNKKIEEFQAIGLPVFILNDPQQYKDYITNRYKIINYTLNSVISTKEKGEFNKKYVPKSPDTILKKLAYIGKVFSSKLIKIIEEPTERNRLFNLEELTIEILKEIGSEAGVDFLPEMYTLTTSSDVYNYDVNKDIRSILNTEFKNKNRLTGIRYYQGSNFTNSAINHDFDFIYYNKHRTKKTAKKEFIIEAKGLVDYVNKNVEETVELEEILVALDLKETLEAKAKLDSLTYPEFIKHQHQITLKDNGTKTKNITGFYLTVEEVANKLFSFNIDFSSDTGSDHEEHIQNVE